MAIWPMVSAQHSPPLIIGFGSISQAQCVFQSSWVVPDRAPQWCTPVCNHPLGAHTARPLHFLRAGPSGSPLSHLFCLPGMIVWQTLHSQTHVITARGFSRRSCTGLLGRIFGQVALHCSACGWSWVLWMALAVGWRLYRGSLGTGLVVMPLQFLCLCILVAAPWRRYPYRHVWLLWHSVGCTLLPLLVLPTQMHTHSP